MQRKKLLSVCVAMALSSQTWAADTSIPDSTEKIRKSSKITCPANIHSLSKEQLENLSAECRENKDSAVLPWAAAGLAAVATGIAIYTLSDDDNHHHNNSPVPDDGGDTPVPPDDGGDTPVKHDPVVYKNGVTWDQDAKTVKIRETTFTYSQNADGSYTLTAPEGKETIVKSWTVHDDSNTVVFDGVNTSGGITWSYDDDGLIHITKEAGVVVDGTTGNAIEFGNAIITDQGGNTALNGGTVMTVDGDNITLNNDGHRRRLGCRYTHRRQYHH